MIGTFARISLATVAIVGLAGVASAADSSAAPKKGQRTSLNGFKPAFRADTSVTGASQPYTWPVSDRYHPVSQPYLGRAY